MRRLGATQKEPVDVWVISATNADLAREVRGRRFREDLYHRLAVMTIRLPALRERGEDIVLLAEHFLERARVDYGLPPLTLTPDARERLRAYSWPGNVRELANVMERAALLGEAPRITAASLGLVEPRADSPPLAAVEAGGCPPAPASLEELLRERLGQVLRQNSWNISRAAEILGMSRNTVRSRIRKFGLRADDVASPPARPGSPPPTRSLVPADAPAPVPPELLRPASGLVRWNGAALPARL